jgi:glycosyltransferase involved in cell wall biosynthesis
VPGDRQAAFADKLGFSQKRILRGVLSCDQEKFAAVWNIRKEAATEARAFAYVGRFSAEKGLDVMVDAYRRYRAATEEPWPLRCYGAGPLRNLLEGVEGVEVRGFCQPDDLPRTLLDAACLILASCVEPWALVVHEAAASGMAVICTDAVGASAHLVRDGHNGYVVKTGDVEALCSAMLKYAGLTAPERRGMAENSYGLSLQFTPEKWAQRLLSKADELSQTVAK